MPSIDNLLKQLKPQQRQRYYEEEKSNFVYYLLLLLFSIFGVHNLYLKQHQYVSFKMQLIIISCLSYVLIGYAMSVTHSIGLFTEFISSSFMLFCIELVRLNVFILIGWTLLYDILFNSAGRYNKAMLEQMIYMNNLETEAHTPDHQDDDNNSSNNADYSDNVNPYNSSSFNRY